MFFLHVVVAIFGPGLGCDVMVAGPSPPAIACELLLPCRRQLFIFVLLRFRLAASRKGALQQRRRKAEFLKHGKPSILLKFVCGCAQISRWSPVPWKAC